MKKHAMYDNLVHLRAVICGSMWLWGPSGGVDTTEKC